MRHTPTVISIKTRGLRTIRTFIAIPLPPAVIDVLTEIQAGLNKGFHGVSWTRPEKIHLTLKFLGEVKDQGVDDIIAALEGVCAGIKGFKVTTGAVGGFPTLRRPRVLWLGIKESPELMGLYGDIEETLTGAGFERDTRRWHPHLTLCRIKSAAAGRALGDLAIKLRHDINIAFEVGSFVLYKSVLSPKGAEYSVIKRFGLTGMDHGGNRG